MERDLEEMPSWMRKTAAYRGATESLPSRSISSGCQSGWTLYLDHSNGVRYLPCDPAAAQRWVVLQAGDDDDDDGGGGGGVEDSMASDASSGPRPRLRGQEEETRRDQEEEEEDDSIGRRSYSSSAHRCASSGCFGSSTWSRSSGSGVKGHVVVHAREATATCQYREIVVDEEDELDDTASSSAVFSSPMAAMVQ